MSLICRGVKVQIICEEESLPFYDVQDQSNKTTAYIASVAGQVFITITHLLRSTDLCAPSTQTFKFTHLSKTNASAMRHIDGRYMQHTLVYANTITPLEGPTMGNLQQRYRFSTLSTIGMCSVKHTFCFIHHLPLVQIQTLSTRILSLISKSWAR